MRESVIKDLAGAHKTTKILGIAVETHQAAILAGTLVLSTVFCSYLAGFFGLSSTRAAIWISPLVLLALVFAFYRSRDGYHLDFIVWRKVVSWLRPEVFFKRPRDNENGGWRSMRDAIQRMLPAEEFYWEMLRCDDGTYAVVFSVIPKKLSMIGDTERMRVFRSAVELYNSLDFPWMEIVRSKEGSTARYTRRFRGTVAEMIPSEERKLRAFASEHAAYLDKELPGLSIFERKGYAVLYYNPATEKAKASGGAGFGPLDAAFKLLGFGGGGKSPGGRPSKRDARRRQQEAEAAYRVLSTRANSFYNGFLRMGCRIRALTDLEFVTYVLGQMTDWNEDSEHPPTLYEPVALEPGGYDEIPEERREKLIGEAEKFREEAPPALGIGDLVADKIAPDCVRIFPDHLRVDGRYHTTMFVSGWPDEVYFGMLSDLNRIEGRVKVVKFIDPRPKKEAQSILGSRWAALRASRSTAADGNVNAEQQREIAEYTYEQAASEVNSGRQRYLELSVLIHLEADNEERLYGMAQEVHDVLQGYRVDSQLAREQMWEGLLSSGPFGKNYLSDRYGTHGMLSRPTACLFSYGSQQIDHENGVFVGVDTRSNSTMTLDTRELVNPHGVILGQSGGGKSFVIKSLSTRFRMFGHRQIIIDPEGNSRYIRVARRVGGAYAVIAPGSKHKINPFDLHEDYMNLDLLEDIFGDEEEEEETDAEEAYEAARAAALDGKAQELTRMVSLMALTDDTSAGAVGGLSGAEASFVERAIYEAYENVGITHDPETHDRPAPIFPEFWEILRGYAEENQLVSELMEKLWSWHSGSLSKIFDAPTNVDLSNRYLVFQISKVKDRQKAPVMHAILEFLNGVLSNRNEPSDCWIDEGWALLAFKMSAEFTETMYRSGRARDNGMWIASQAVNEFVESRQGNVILDLAATHMIFRHEHQKSARATASIHDLSEEETEELLSFQPGEGYLVVDQSRVPMEVLASEKEKELYNTNPRIEAAYKEQRRTESQVQQRVIRDEQVETAAGARRREKALVPGLPGGNEPMHIYAFTGPGSTETAAAVAKLFGRAARKERLYVLAVDACGGILSRKLSAGGEDQEEHHAGALDAFLRRGSADLDALGEHVSKTHLPALRVVRAPKNGSLPAYALQEASREVFDLCVVACGTADTSYAEDWLQDAEAVVACSAEGTAEALQAARMVEEKRGANATLLAVTNRGTGGASKTFATPDGGRPLYRLGPAASSGTQSDNGLRDLTRDLLATANTAANASENGAGSEPTNETHKEEAHA